MISSVCLCCQHNTNKDFLQSFPPPLSVIQFRLNGQCWVWGKVSEDVGGMEIVLFFVGNASSTLCFRGFDVSVRPALTDSNSINQTNSVLCHILTHSFMTQEGARSLHFSPINCCFLVTSLCMTGSHLCLGIMDSKPIFVWQYSIFLVAKS